MMNVHFLVPDLAEVSSEERLFAACADGRYCWSALPWYHLKGAGLEVSIGDEVMPGAINVAHGRFWREWSYYPASVRAIVSCDADWPPLPWADFQIVQNMEQLGGSRCRWMPHWPQPGLVKRGRVGGAKLRVGYFGRIDDEREFERFRGLVEDRGFEYVHKLRPDWHDYGDVDMAVSLRFLSLQRIQRKPPTKLLNAWHAGVPFVCMEESGYRQVGTPGVDYLEASSLEGVVDHIVTLGEREDFYLSLVERGRVMAEVYSEKSIACRWVQVLQQIDYLSRRFGSWRRIRGESRFLIEKSKTSCRRMVGRC